MLIIALELSTGASRTNQYGRRTYDMVNEKDGKWSLRRILLRKALIDYEAETVTTFKLRHCWEILKGRPKWMQSEVPKFAGKSGEGSKRYKTFGSNSFNIEFREASINMNVDVGDDEEDEVQEIRRPIGRDKAQDAMKKKGSRASGSSSMNDEALARLMVFEMVMQNERAIKMQKEERLAFLDIKRREAECRERGACRATMEALREGSRRRAFKIDGTALGIDDKNMGSTINEAEEMMMDVLM
ncbi:zinc finger BED domain-containing protein RICESLEEPER 2-like protein [Tanacetum coccineum]